MPMPTQGTISSRYGMRNGKMHYGIDIAAPTGTKVISLYSGIVTSSGSDGSRGVYLAIKGGKIEQWFYHLSKKYVGLGQNIKAGQVVAAVGNTGRSTGSHLHWGIKVSGKWVNPEPYFNTGDVDIEIFQEKKKDADAGIIDQIFNNILSFLYTYLIYFILVILFFYLLIMTYK
jgi:murein DD-endopeptidase MepM/ murein hydrolase activator NlpD